jgi:hypothetical protein
VALDVRLDTPLYTGGAIAVGGTPIPYDVAIGGRRYLVSFEFTPFRREAFRHRNIEIIRTQADTGGVPGEQTLNPAGLWRRSHETWHHGAGQVYLDRKTSDSARFHYSKGVDVFVPWEWSLLNDTQLAYASAGTNVMLGVTLGRVYFVDGTTLGWTTTPYTLPWTPTTTTLPNPVSSHTTDGYWLWVCCGASGVWAINDSQSAAGQLTNDAMSANAVIGYALGRLILGDGNKLYNIISPTRANLPAPLASSYLSSQFRFTAISEGLGYIYAAGNLGNQGQIFKISITADGTSLGAPSAAVPGLPYGETINSMRGVAGVQVIGTNAGIRIGVPDASGNLTLGSVIVTPNPVNCPMEVQQKFVWFPLTNYDGVSTGLGRIDLSTLGALSNAPDTPGWASDLMYTGQGAITDIASWANVGHGAWVGRMFAVAGAGVVVESFDTPVAQGVMQSGLISYDLADYKYAVYIDVAPGPGVGTLAAALSVDKGPFVACGNFATQSSSRLQYSTPQTPANVLEMQFTMTSQHTKDAGEGVDAEVNRTTLRSMVAAVAPMQFLVPLRLSRREMTEGMGEASFTPSDDLEFLNNLRLSRSITTYQEGRRVTDVTIDMLDWTPQAFTGVDRQEMAGICVVTMTSIS